MRAGYEPQRDVFLYLDEVTYNRQPTRERAYGACGHQQPLAYRSYKTDRQFGGIGALNAITGQVTYRQHDKIKLHHRSDFYAAIRDDYPAAEVIYGAQDNGPVHVHPDVVIRLQEQHSPFWAQVAGNWSDQPRAKAIQCFLAKNSGDGCDKMSCIFSGSVMRGKL